ncbi:hypothetical protein [Deefgea rivuli]|uniref:hypothetical protein n=1 Tax=Deefgea rivuli TaxID=400948 RepID=UPI00048797A7|nr:hypothetical protein [Deefgea rivuli]
MDSTYFAKTTAGFKEITARSANLSFRERQLLIVIDGQMSVEALTQLMPLADLLIRLEKLQAAGLIHAVDTNLNPTLSNLQPLPAAEALAEIRSILQQGNMLYLGGSFTTILQAQFDHAQTPQELEDVIETWHTELLNQGKMRYAEQQAAQIKLLFAMRT